MRELANPIVHIEIPVTDIEKAKEFYSKIFGWKIYEKSGFTLFETGTPIGGSFRKVDKVIADGCLFYIGVSDIKEKLEEIEKAGGKTLKKMIEIPGGEGWQATFKDVFGNTFYLFKPMKKI